MSGSKLTRYGDLTSEQILAIDLLVLKQGSEMTYTEIAELVGVSVKTLERWRKLPEFQKEVNLILQRCRVRWVIPNSLQAAVSLAPATTASLISKMAF